VEQSLISHDEAFDDSTTDLLNDLQYISWQQKVERVTVTLLGAANVCGKPK
jgi:hypothetical protein